MLYKSVKNVVWSNKSGADVLASERRLPAPVFNALSQILRPDELSRMYREWEAGQREIRMENGFIVTCFTPPRDKS